MIIVKKRSSLQRLLKPSASSQI